MEATMKVPKWRMITFRILAGLLGLVSLVFSLPVAVFTWFDHGADSIHHVHFVAGVGYGLVLGVGLLLMAWKPSRYIASAQALIAFGVAGVVSGLLGADFLEGGGVVTVVAVVVLVALHPARRDVLRFGSPDLRLAIVPVLSLIPAVAYSLSQATLQRDGVASDPHVDLHHYSGMVFVLIGLALTGVVVSMRATGWRPMAWFVGVSLAALGAVSLAFPDHPSAFASVWAWAAIAGGAAFVMITETVARGPDAT